MSELMEGHLDEFVELLDAWLYEDDPKEANQIGEQMSSLIQYVPSECKVAPPILYRAIAISNSLLHKIKNEERSSIILKNRKYSSWTYNEGSAMSFAFHMQPPKRATNVILKKRIPPSSILLNVYKFIRYMSKKATTPIFDTETRSVAFQEKEIIVQTSSTFEIKPQDIYIVMDIKHSKWISFSEFKI